MKFDQGLGMKILDLSRININDLGVNFLRRIYKRLNRLQLFKEELSVSLMEGLLLFALRSLKKWS